MKVLFILNHLLVNHLCWSFTQPSSLNLMRVKVKVNKSPNNPMISSSIPHSTSLLQPVKVHSPFTSLSSSSLRSSTSSVNTKTKNTILPASILVGALAAGVGIIYGRLLGTFRNKLWGGFTTSSSSSLLSILNNNNIPAPFLIPILTTFGGLFIGILSNQFEALYSVNDFVSAFSNAGTGQIITDEDLPPNSRTALLPLLLFCLLTSSFGFSLGPEAPMVGAGSLVGVSVAKWIYGGKENILKKENKSSEIATLAVAGAAGTLTAFMGIPIAGSIFALELMRSSTALKGGPIVSNAIAASLTGLVVLRGFLVPNLSTDGHFHYGHVGNLSGREMLLMSLLGGISGAAIGTFFNKTLMFLKKFLWPAKKSKPNSSFGFSKRRNVAIKTLIGFLVGILSLYYPQTLFWGEGSLQMVIDGQKTAWEATKHGLPSLFTSFAKVNPSLPYATATDAFQIGFFKLIAILLASAAKFPGGIIFPLFFAAAPFAHGLAHLFQFHQLNASLVPVLVMCLMSSAQASVTRTPLASALILALTSTGTELSLMLPACLAASYVSVWASEFFSSKSYFAYKDSDQE